MINKDSIYQVVSEKIAGTDFFIVDVSVNQNNQISVEIDANDGISIDFCAELNKYISSKFEEEIDDYDLEVSSGGIGQPFKVLKQYQKFIDQEVEVLTLKGIKYSGFLVEVNDNNFTVEITKKVKLPDAKRKTDVTENVVFGYNEIKYTKYIIRF
jgi:ribosome maturation factor RimP